MPEPQLFEYAIIRIVPRVEREEFFNAGVILYCAARQFLDIKYLLSAEKLSVFCKEVDVPELEARFHAMKKICIGGKEGGLIGKYPAASRFRWLSAARSTVIQLSPVHPGWCADPEAKLQSLFEQLVL